MISEVLPYNQMPQAGDLLFSEDLSEDINMGSWRQSEESLLTVGASTCIILAAHNDVTKRGILGHFSSISNEDEAGYWDSEVFDETVCAIRSLGPGLETSVWLGGGTANIEDGRDSVEPDRIHAEAAVRDLAEDARLAGDQMFTRWSGLGRVIDVELDCPSGILVVHDYPEGSDQTVRDMLSALAAQS